MFKMMKTFIFMFKNFPEQWQDLLKEKGITTETAIQKELFAPIHRMVI